MEATCCDKQDVHQDVGFKQRDYRAVPLWAETGDNRTGSTVAARCQVEASGDARSTPRAAAAAQNHDVLTAFSDGDGHWTSR